ncbi:cytochrome P450 [Mangrovihabitans endophyticus]|uniref:Cytochrome P450 hydroxylase n=1 Tax=Mangrovihabitans endophyticus TaxID=1751298 RepID=A0A8J3FME2_9ACTN|nr:cytochrome P450 [Mangrovihabitans endophyticus]GGK72662.1 cytochrome P450 hydroxylase [Mangrovihabitans endophyticus]
MAIDFGYLAALARSDRDHTGGDPDPYPNLAWLRRESPVTRVPGPGGVGTAWFVTSYALARDCLADPRLEMSAAPGEPGVPASRLRADAVPVPHFLATNPPVHDAQRQAVAASFSPRAVEKLREPAARYCHELIDRFAGRGEADLLTEYALLIPEHLTYELFGVPRAQRLPEGRATTLSVAGALSEQPDGGPLTGELLDHLRQVLEYKRRQPGDDLVTRLLAAMDENAALHAAYLLFATGQLSTGPAIGATIVRLLERPGLYAAVSRDPAGCRRAVDEALRFDSAVQSALPRRAREDLEIGGTRVTAGDIVLVSLAAANRDPGRFADPDRFDPGRAGGSHLAFGHGIHYCLGGPLARMEGEVALSVLVDRLPGLRPGGSAGRGEWALGPLLRGPATVLVRFDVGTAGPAHEVRPDGGRPSVHGD